MGILGLSSATGHKNWGIRGGSTKLPVHPSYGNKAWLREPASYDHVLHSNELVLDVKKKDKL